MANRFAPLMVTENSSHLRLIPSVGFASEESTRSDGLFLLRDRWQVMHLKHYLAFLMLLFIVVVSQASYAAQALDQYGGTTGVQCSKGPAPHFYTEKIGDRWWLCDPAGNGFWLKSVSDISFNVNTGQDTQAAAKYATGLSRTWQYNWSLEQLNRMRSWGMNGVDGYQYYRLTPFYTDSSASGWPAGDHTIPVHMPQNYISGLTRYSFENANNCSITSAVKDMINGVGAAYTAWRYDFGDYFDPNFSTCLGNVLAGANPGVHGEATGINNDYLLSITIDESGQTGGPLGPGPDFSTLPSMSLGANGGETILATAPTQSGTSGSSVQNSLSGGTYSNQTVYTKLAMANYYATEYICTGSGKPIAACTGNHTGTGSIDPNSSSYFGSTNLANGIAALNTAWNSFYSSWVSDTPHCGTNLATCLSGGTLSDFGTGDGLLEENGACPSKGAHPCWTGDPCTLTLSSAAQSCSTGITTAETSAMQADMSAFYSAYLDQYYSVMKAQWHNATYGAPGVLLLTQVGSGWNTPPRKEVLTEAVKYMDLIGLGAIPAAPWSCGTCTDNQARINFVAQYAGSVPWVEWEGFDANSDSAESAYSSSIGSPYTTQEQRGAGFQSMVTGLVNANDTATGTYNVVGYEWWDMFDMNSQQLNWGLVTPLDNPYDGKGATIKGAEPDQWGYPTGGELANYGNFLSAVSAANHLVESQLAGTGGPVTRSAAPPPTHP